MPKYPRIDFAEAIGEPLLFARSWLGLSKPQQVVLKVIYGLALTDAEEKSIWSVLTGNAQFDALGRVLRIFPGSTPLPPTTEQEDVTLIVGRRAGKALDATTPIPTPVGWKTIGMLKVGDQVFAEDGTPTTVIATSEIQHNRVCLRVDFSDRNTLVVDEDHQWTVWSKAARKALIEPYRKAKEQVLTTKELLATLKTNPGESNWSVPLAGAIEYTEKVLGIPPYLLGLWLGDGTSQGAVITTADSEVLQSFRTAGFPTTLYKKTTSPDYHYGIGNGFYKALRKLNLLDNKHIPSIYLEGSVQQRLSLLQGLMDSAGYAIARACEFSNTNPLLVLGCKELAESLGFRVYVRSKIPTLYGKPCRRCWTVSFKAPWYVFRLARKAIKQQLLLTTKKRFRYIVSITPVSSRPVCCIEVDSPSHLYLAGKACIPTHNSQNISSFIAAYEALCGGHKEFVAERQDPVILQVAQDLSTAKANLRQFILYHLEQSPIGKKELGDLNKSVTAETIKLKHALITVGPPTVKLRSQAVAICLMDELAVWPKEREAASPDYEVERAVRPAMSQFPFRKLVKTSTPWTEEGLLWEAADSRRKGQLAPGQLVITATTASMQNPLVPMAYLASEQRKDPEAFRREYLAEFAKSVSGFLSASLLRAALDAREPAKPEPNRFRYVATIDPAFRRDAFAFVLGHLDAGNFITDVVWHIRGTQDAPVSPSLALATVAQLCAPFGVRHIITDQWHQDSLQELALGLNLVLEPVTLTNQLKATMWGDVAALLVQKKIRIPSPERNDSAAQLYTELEQLEKTLNPSGSVSIAGRRDDLAMAFALCVHRTLQFGESTTAKPYDANKIVKTFQQERNEMMQRTTRATKEAPWYA
jgi:hypothetical protein